MTERFIEEAEFCFSCVNQLLLKHKIRKLVVYSLIHFWKHSLGKELCRADTIVYTVFEMKHIGRIW